MKPYGREKGGLRGELGKGEREHEGKRIHERSVSRLDDIPSHGKVIK